MRRPRNLKGLVTLSQTRNIEVHRPFLDCSPFAQRSEDKSGLVEIGIRGCQLPWAVSSAAFSGLSLSMAHAVTIAARSNLWNFKWGFFGGHSLGRSVSTNPNLGSSPTGRNFNLVGILWAGLCPPPTNLGSSPSGKPSPGTGSRKNMLARDIYTNGRAEIQSHTTSPSFSSPGTSHRSPSSRHRASAEGQGSLATILSRDPSIQKRTMVEEQRMGNQPLDEWVNWNPAPTGTFVGFRLALLLVRGENMLLLIVVES